MQVKYNFLNYIQEVENIIEPLNISDSGLMNIGNQIKTTELIVPVVGGFSSGKSTLINSFLDKHILPTSITPETALATELRYSIENYIEAVKEDGNYERYDLSDFNQIKDNAQNFQFLRVFINNERLKDIQPLVLVDMPGFDAPIESHNKAILNYLNKGVYFIFLTSVEDGTITRSMTREIDTLYDIGKGYSFCLSKTNLRKPQDVIEIKNNISQYLIDSFGYHKDIVLLDKNGGQNLSNILQSINPEELFRALFIEQLRGNVEQIKSSFDTVISTLSRTEKQAEKAIEELRDGIKEVESKRENAIREAKSRYSHNSINAIVNAVIKQLHLSKDYLVSLAMSNQEGFRRELNDIIKSTVVREVQYQFREMSEDIITDFGDAIKDLNLSELNQFNLGGEFIDKISKQIMDQILSNTTDSVGKILETLATMSGILGKIFKLLGPLLSTVLAYLPNIIGSLFSRNNENETKEKVNTAILTMLIPQIESQLKQTLPNLLDKNVEELINSIGKQFEMELNQKTLEIEQAVQEKVKDAEVIRQKIETLQSSKQNLITLFNKL